MGRPEVDPATSRPMPSAALVALTVLVVLAAYRAVQPIAGDQALAIHIGRRLRAGEVMYVDVWDIRQPLTFYWYAVVGWVLGGTALALRVGELVWNGILAWLIAHDVARHRGNVEGAVTALAAVGPLFWMMRANDVAQPDTLAMLPIYLVFRATLLPGRDPLRPVTSIALGFSAVALGLIKITLAPLPFVFVGTYVVVQRSRGRRATTAAGLMLSAFVVGAGIVVGYFVAHGDWAWVRHTWFEQAPAMRSLAPPRPRRLFESWLRLAIFAAPVIVGAVAGLWRGRDRSDPLIVGAAAWLVVVAVLLLPQQWWAYQWLAVTVPLGLLAGGPLAELVRRRGGVVAAVVFVVVAMLASDRGYTRALFEHGPDRSAIALDLQSAVVERDEARAFLAAPSALPGDVYAFANPLVLHDLGRRQRLAIHGWSPEFYDDTTWERHRYDFADTPPTYLIIDEFSRRTIAERAPALLSWLADHYELAATLSSGSEILAVTR